MGVFEGVRAYQTRAGTAIFRLREHTDRLFRSAHIFGMKIPFSKDEINAAQVASVRDNKLESCYIRPIAVYGSNGWGSQPSRTRCASRSPRGLGRVSRRRGSRKGIRVKTSSFTRHHVNITMTGAKACANYLNSILANQEATHDGYDEALCSTRRLRVGRLGENVFMRDGRRAAHAGHGSGALKGVTRDSVMTIARDRYQGPERRILATKSIARRSVLHRHGRGSHAHSRARQPRDRRGQRGPITHSCKRSTSMR
jgi:branched-chain amino acid aminotransferase